jgi:hypothetical protein
MLYACTAKTRRAVTRMNSRRSWERSADGIISAVSAGVFLILIGVLFIVTPNLYNSLVNFFTGFEVVQVRNISGLYLPAPRDPSAYGVVYSAAAQFSIAWAIFLIGALTVRFFMHSSFYRKARNASDIVFWLGTSYLITQFLNDTTTRVDWFAFWAAMIILIGVTMIIRAAVLAMFSLVS